MRSITDTHRGIATAFWRDGAVDTSISSRWLVNVGHRDAKTRLSHLLCELSTRYHVQPMNGTRSFKLPLTQTSLGEATGLTAVHVNRTLRYLALEGIATVKGGTVDITDWERLSRAGEFDAGYLHS